MPTTKLEDLLKSPRAGDLNTLIRRARDMDSLGTALKGSLASELAEQLVGANLRNDGELVLVCSSSAWASRLRFEGETLLGAARAAGFDASSMRVTVSQQF